MKELYTIIVKTNLEKTKYAAGFLSNDGGLNCTNVKSKVPAESYAEKISIQ